MKKRHSLLIALLATLTFVVGYALLNPMRQSEIKIRERLLKKMPLGTPAIQVLAVVREDFVDKAWSQPQYETGWGAVRRSLLPYDPNRAGSRNVNEIVGTRSIRDVHVGSYSTIPLIPMVTHVFVSWAFNDDDKLIDIIVYKETDSP